MVGHNVSPVKSSEDRTYSCSALVIQRYDYCIEPDIILTINYFEVFGGGNSLAMPKTIYASDTSSLKTGSGATEGVQDYGVLVRPGYVMWAGLIGRQDTGRRPHLVSGRDSRIRGWQV